MGWVSETSDMLRHVPSVESDVPSAFVGVDSSSLVASGSESEEAIGSAARQVQQYSASCNRVLLAALDDAAVETPACKSQTGGLDSRELFNIAADASDRPITEKYSPGPRMRSFPRTFAVLLQEEAVPLLESAAPAVADSAHLPRVQVSLSQS